MNLENVNNTLAFLQRVNLQGNEAPAFMQCITALQLEGQRLAQLQQQQQGKQEPPKE